MLADLMTSFEMLRVPAGCEVAFVVINNAPDLPVSRQVRAWGDRTGHSVRSVVEAEPGIAFARNRALREARALDADLILFVDDDETVDAEWLERITAHRAATGAQFVGGPVRCRPSTTPMSWVERMIFLGVCRGYDRRERKNAGRAKAGRAGEVTLITNNWLGDLRWIAAQGLEFDRSLAATGGEDTQFYDTVKQRGAVTSWCPEAIVYETVPPDRLSFGYQFRRARDQARTSQLRKAPADRHSLPVSAGIIVIKVAFGTVLVLIAPFAAGRTLVDATRAFGVATGHTLALFGRPSQHYAAPAARGGSR